MRLLLALMTLIASSAFAQTVTDPAQIALVCAYNSAVPAPVSGQYAFVQCDSTGKIITAGASTSPGGTSTQIQYNNSGAFGGITGSSVSGADISFTGKVTTTNFFTSGGTGYGFNGSSGASVGLTISGAILNLNSGGANALVRAQDNSGNVAATFYPAATASEIKTTIGTVAQLRSAATAGAGARAFVSDAVACTFAADVTGGGSTPCPVYSDGTSWKGG